MIKKGIIAWIVSGIFVNLWALLTCVWLFRWVYFVKPIHVYRSWVLEFTLAYAFFSVVLNFVFTGLFVLFYALIQKGLSGKGIKKGLIIGLSSWLVGGAVSWVRVALTLDVSGILFIDWMVNGFISYVGVGAIIGKVYEG